MTKMITKYCMPICFCVCVCLCVYVYSKIMCCSVMESSKDYLAKALVNTVDHLGSVADKLNKFLDEKADEFKATNTRFSCIEQV